MQYVVYLMITDTSLLLSKRIGLSERIFVCIDSYKGIIHPKRIEERGRKKNRKRNHLVLVVISVHSIVVETHRSRPKYRWLACLTMKLATEVK